MLMYKRKRTTRRKPRRVRARKSYARRSTAIAPRKALSINKNPVSYHREMSYGVYSIAPAGNTLLNSYTFTLQQLVPNYTEFTTLFDQYRLRCLVFKIRMVRSPDASSTTANGQYYPDIYCAVDHDDATIPANVDAVMQYGKVKSGILKPNVWFKYKCYPTPSTTVYRGVTAAYMPVKINQWIDLAYTDVQFYGIKLAVDATSIGNQTDSMLFEVRIWSKWEFKNSR